MKKLYLIPGEKFGDKFLFVGLISFALLGVMILFLKKIAEEINQNNEQKQEIISKESLYRAFVRALQDAPEKSATFVSNLNSKIITREVLKEQKSGNRRFNPILI